MSEVDTREPLDVVAKTIEAHAKKSDEYIISAAMLLGEARRRVDAGEAGNVKWGTWAPENIHLSLSRLRDLQRIAEADNPAKELERQRSLTRIRVAKLREKRAGEVWRREEERNQLIGWAKKAPIELVRRTLRQVNGQPAGRRLASIETGSVARHRQAA